MNSIIPEEIIAEFQQAVKEEYGRDISPKEANEILSGMVGYFDTLAKMAHDMRLE